LSDVANIFIPEFETINKEDIPKNALIFRSSSLAGCFSQSYRIMNKLGDHSDSSKRYFINGTKIHYFRDKLTIPAYPLHKEDDYYIYNKKNNYYVKGQMDFIGLDELGVFILDYKSTSLKSFIYKLNKGMPDNNYNQLSTYKFIYYVHCGVDVEWGVIRYIDRGNIRNSMQISSQLKSLKECQDFILNHPLILYTLKKINKLKFKEYLEEYNKKNKFMCQKLYCGFNDCIMHKNYNASKKEDIIFK